MGKYYHRRMEGGKAFIDVAKYSFTVGIIGGVLSDKFTFMYGIIVFLGGIVCAVVGAIMLPPKEGN